MPMGSVRNAVDAQAIAIRNRLRAAENRIASLESNTSAWTYGQVAANKVLANREFAFLNAANLQLTLPATPTLGMRVAIHTQDTTSTLLRNGQRIMGKPADLPLNVLGITVYLTFVNATKGWVLT